MLKSQVVMAPTDTRGTASAKEQKDRTPEWFGLIGDAMIWYAVAGDPSVPERAKLYPLLVPDASWLSIKHALVALGGAQVVPPKAASVLA
ncbi:MAG TPA: hypothetical protein VMI10_15250 [Terriglobales bacterium]|nr:hypothetical protein [Terriglobales bacterium]